MLYPKSAVSTLFHPITFFAFILMLSSSVTKLNASGFPEDLQLTFEEIESVQYIYDRREPEPQLFFDFSDGEPLLSFMILPGTKTTIYDFVNKEIISDYLKFDHTKGSNQHTFKIFNPGYNNQIYVFYEDNRLATTTYIYNRNSKSVTKLDGIFGKFDDTNQDGSREICIISEDKERNKILSAYGVVEGADGKSFLKKLSSGRTDFNFRYDIASNNSTQVFYDEQLASLFVNRLNKEQEIAKNKKYSSPAVNDLSYPNAVEKNYRVNSMHSTKGKLLIKVPLSPKKDNLAFSSDIGLRSRIAYDREEQYTGNNRDRCRGRCTVSDDIGFYYEFFSKSPVVVPVAELGRVRIQGVSLTDRERAVLTPKSLKCTTALIDETLFCGKNDHFKASKYQLENGVTLHFGFAFLSGRLSQFKYMLSFAEANHNDISYSLAVDSSYIVLFSGHMEHVVRPDYDSSREALNKHLLIYPDLGYKTLSYVRMYETISLLPHSQKGINTFFNYVFTLDGTGQLHFYKPILTQVNSSAQPEVEKW